MPESATNLSQHSKMSGMAPSALSDPTPRPTHSNLPGAGSSSARSTTAKLPKIHWYSFKGDLNGVMACVAEGHSLHETVTLRNQHGKLVSGITPLFLAAQRGHLEVVRLLVENGANPQQPCFIQGTTEICTPAEVASLNMHLRTSRYIRRAVGRKKEEDKVLDEDETRSTYSRASRMSGIGRALSKLSRRSLQPAPSGVSVARTQVDELGGVAAAKYVQNFDLANIDLDDAPAPTNKKSDKGLKNLFSWFGTQKKPAASASNRSQDTPAVVKSLKDVKGNWLQENPEVHTADNTNILSRFMKDINLEQWTPDDNLDTCASATPARPVSPARSLRSNTTGKAR